MSSFLQPFLGRVSNLLGALPSLSMASMFTRSAARRSDVWGSGAFADKNAGRRMLRAVVAAQIVPRLVRSHRVAEPHTEVAHQLPDAAEVQAFAHLCAGNQPPTAGELVNQLKAGGRRAETVYLNLIAPAARYLGEQWDNDDLGFAQVSTGLALMHQVIHGLGSEGRSGPKAAGDGKRVMLACAPGSAHLLGLVIVSEFFLGAGWQVVLEVAPTRDALERAVKSEWFDLVGISAALELQLAALPALVAGLKAASLNPALAVLLGGPVFATQEHEAAHFGAMAICTDPRAAVTLAQSLQA